MPSFRVLFTKSVEIHIKCQYRSVFAHEGAVLTVYRQVHIRAFQNVQLFDSHGHLAEQHPSRVEPLTSRTGQIWTSKQNASWFSMY